MSCETPQELDSVWSGLSAVPEAEHCGWLKDKYGVSWQVVPADRRKRMREADPEQREWLMVAVLSMKKLDWRQLDEI